MTRPCAHLPSPFRLIERTIRAMRRQVAREPKMEDPWILGDAYEGYIGRWSRLVAPRFLAWLDRPHGQRWLDVGCGTGALLQAILDHATPSTVVGVEPSAGFLATARERLGARAELRQGDAASTGLADAAVDVTVSGLVLNFVPDVGAALAEMRRVTRRGGTVAAYLWDYADRMELIRHFWDAAVALDPAAAAKHEGTRFPLCRRDTLREAFTRAGLGAVAVDAIDVPTPFADFEAYWRPFLGGQGPAPGYAMSLDEATRTRLRNHLRERLPVAADGSIALVARAWAVRGEA
jgi:SAM-dependent methyltransferase